MKIEQQDFRRIKDLCGLTMESIWKNKAVLNRGVAYPIWCSGPGLKIFILTLILSFGIRRREQINLLVNTLTTNYTFFMREPSITSF